MKKVFITLTLLAIAFVAGAGNSDLFELDQEGLNAEFADLNKLEVFVESNANISLGDLLAEDSDVLSGLNISQESVSSLAMGLLEPPLGIPSFFWGCVLSWVGILVVYLITEDGDETKKAMFGCLAGAGVSLIFWVVYVLIIGNSFLFL